MPTIEEPRKLRVLIACEYSGRMRDAFTEQGHHAVSCDLLPAETPGIHYQGDVLELLDGWEPVQFGSQCDPDGDGWCSVQDCDPSCCHCIGPTMEDEVEYREVNGVLLGRPVDNPHWDLMIAHPPCTYLSVSGMHWTTRGLRDPKLTEDALEFVQRLLDAPIQSIVVENPVSVISTRIRKPDQAIHPWMFGDDASKKTCFWLKNLRPLEIHNRLIVPPKGWRLHRFQQGHTLKKIEGFTFCHPDANPPKPVWANQTPSGQNRLGPSDDRWKIRSETFPGIARAAAEQWGSQVAAALGLTAQEEDW